MGLKQDLVLANQLKDAVLSANQGPHSSQTQNVYVTFGFRWTDEFEAKMCKTCQDNVIKWTASNQIMSW